MTAPATLYSGYPMTEGRLACLGELTKVGPRGTCALRGVMDGGHLATLVAMGLAERTDRDQLGGLRYRVTAAGLEAWADWTRPAPTKSRARSGPQGTVASKPDPDPVSFYPTPPWAARAGGELLQLVAPRARTVWEPAAGAHHMAHGLRDYFRVFTSDAFDYGTGDSLYDFRSDDPAPFDADLVVTNPPFHDDCIAAFIRGAYSRGRMGAALFMRLGVLSGQARHAILYGDCPLSYVAAFSERVAILRQRWEPDGSTASDYAWFFFLKGRLHPRLSVGRYVGLDIPPGTEDRLTKPSDARLFGVRPMGGAA